MSEITEAAATIKAADAAMAAADDAVGAAWPEIEAIMAWRAHARVKQNVVDKLKEKFPTLVKMAKLILPYVAGGGVTGGFMGWETIKSGLAGFLGG